MSQPSYQELCDNNEGSWITDGPNSGGQEGWILSKGLMFFFGGDWSMAAPAVSPGITLAAFIERHQNDTRPRVAALVRELAKRLNTDDATT